MKSKDSKDQLGKLSQPEPEMDSGGADRSKRHLLKGVISTAPVVLAVSSKPALANFCTVSGFLSGNLSNPNSQTYCGGRSPGYWMNHGHPDKSLSFKAVYGKNWEGNYSVYLNHSDKDDGPKCYPLKVDGSWVGEPTLDRVLRMDGNDDLHQFGAHATAAYLNSVAFAGTYPMTKFQVGEIVADVLQNREYYNEATGKTLDILEVIEFFEQTYDAH